MLVLNPKKLTPVVSYIITTPKEKERGIRICKARYYPACYKHDHKAMQKACCK